MPKREKLDVDCARLPALRHSSLEPPSVRGGSAHEIRRIRRYGRLQRNGMVHQAGAAIEDKKTLQISSCTYVRVVVKRVSHEDAPEMIQPVSERDPKLKSSQAKRLRK